MENRSSRFVIALALFLLAQPALAGRRITRIGEAPRGLQQIQMRMTPSQLKAMNDERKRRSRPEPVRQVPATSRSSFTRRQASTSQPAARPKPAPVVRRLVPSPPPPKPVFRVPQTDALSYLDISRRLDGVLVVNACCDSRDGNDHIRAVIADMSRVVNLYPREQAYVFRLHSPPAWSSDSAELRGEIRLTDRDVAELKALKGKPRIGAAIGLGMRLVTLMSR